MTLKLKDIESILFQTCEIYHLYNECHVFFSPLNFNFKMNHNKEASSAHRAGIKLSGPEPVMGGFTSPFIYCPPDVLILPGLHKGPILLFLIFEMAYFLFNDILYSFLFGKSIVKY